MSHPGGFFAVGGTLEGDAPSYIHRKADQDLYEGLKEGKFCYVLDSRQIGKSSLMIRAQARLSAEGFAVAVLDLQREGKNLTPEQWYGSLISQLGEQLGLVSELEEFFWDEKRRERLGPLERWMRAIREVILPHSTTRVVIFIDEIDFVRSLQGSFSTDEFFAGIREFYNRRPLDPELNRLAFCLLGCATPSDLIQDVRTTPFNIGQRVEMTDFTEEEAAPLGEGLGRDEKLSQALLKRILYWTGGHPYLTQRFGQAVAEDPGIRSPGDVDKLCESLYLSLRARGDDHNLAFVRDKMLKSDVDRAGLLDLYMKVRKHKPVRDDETNPFISVLRLSGITRIVQGLHYVRNRIYYRVFDVEWVMANMPNAELQRQRAAIRRGRMQVGALAAALSLIFLSLAGYAWWESEKAERSAREARKQAARAEGNAEEAQKEAKEKDQQKALAEENAKLANQQRERAKKNEDKAREQAKLAEERLQQKAKADEGRDAALADARKSEKLAEDNAKEATRQAKEASRQRDNFRTQVNSSLQSCGRLAEQIWDVAQRQTDVPLDSKKPSNSGTGSEAVAKEQAAGGRMEMYGVYAAMLRECRDLANGVLKLDPESFDAKNSKAAHLVLEAEALRHQKDPKAREMCDEAIRDARKLKADGQKHETQILAARTFVWAGGELFELGERDNGLNAINQGAKLAREVRDRPDTKDFDFWDWHTLALVYEWNGKYLDRANNLPRAIEAYVEANKMDSQAAKVADAKDRVRAWRYAMAHSSRIGDLEHKLGHNDLALAAYDHNLNIAAYVNETERSVRSRRDLAEAYDKLAQLQSEKENKSTARDAYRKELEILAEFANSKDRSDRRQLLFAHRRMASLLLEMHDFEGARRSNADALQIAIDLGQTKTDEQGQRDLSTTLAQCAAIEDIAGNQPAGQKAFEQSLAVVTELARSKGTIEARHQLIADYRSVGSYLIERKDIPGALAAYQRAVRLASELAKDPNNTHGQEDLIDSYGSLSWVELFNRRFQQTIDAAETALKLASKLNSKPASDFDWIKTNLAHGYLFSGRVSEARNIYLENKNKQIFENQTFAQAVLNDFKELRDRGITDAAMTEIERLLRAEK